MVEKRLIIPCQNVLSGPAREERILEFFFGDHLLDIDRRELRRGAELIAVEPQVFDLLVYLVRNRHRVVSKDDLVESVWGGRIVSESTLTSRINAVRRAIGDKWRGAASNPDPAAQGYTLCRRCAGGA